MIILVSKEANNYSASVALTTPSFGASKKDKKKAEQSDKTQTEDDEGKEAGTGEEDSVKEAGKTKDPDSPGGLTIKGNAEVEKVQQDIFRENEITISVNWSGGGQELKEGKYIALYSHCSLYYGR